MSERLLVVLLVFAAGCFDFGPAPAALPIDCAIDRAADRFPDVCGVDGGTDDAGPSDAATD